MEPTPQYDQATVKTAGLLRNVAKRDDIRRLSRLTLPEVDAVVETIAQVIPAGNLPGIILNGLAHLPDRRPPPNIVRRDIQLLFAALEQFMDRAVYGTVFAGPAAVIWGYQNLLRLAGKDPNDAFPQGAWQFYVEYAMREDTARHANETVGFDRLLGQHGICLTPTDRLTAWTMAAITTLTQYQDLLTSEWRERVYTFLLSQVAISQPGLSPAEAARWGRLYRAWEAQRPYRRGAEAAALNYPAYRRLCFDRFLGEALAHLPLALRDSWQAQAQAAEAEELPAYQAQMSILAALEPGLYGETRQTLTLQQTHVGLIVRGAYFLIPVCQANGDPLEVQRVRELVAALLAAKSPEAAGLTALARARRSALPELRRKWGPDLQEAFAALRTAPILINAGPFPHPVVAANGRTWLTPLAEIRQAERGVGDHPLTIFDTGASFVFDQSHIFFDGIAGAALAEIITNEALSWAVYLNTLSEAAPAAQPPRRLAFHFAPDLKEAMEAAPKVALEAAAETDSVNLRAILRLRQLFKQRNDLIELTVNDLLVLYRAIHALVYRPSPTLLNALRVRLADPRTGPAAQSALDALAEPPAHPAVLIPVDESPRSPRERLSPLNFEIPVRDLNLLELHGQTLQALAVYQGSDLPGERGEIYARFDRLQREYLASLAGFGAVMRRAKEVALSGQTASLGSIKMLAFLPTPLQRMLEGILTRIDILNDLIKGREIFSNIGQVASSSTLERFTTAKDDNDKKTLTWGILTDAEGRMHLSLRDFRPHVALLTHSGQADLAHWIAQEYLDAYADGLNSFITDLHMITLASRETRLERPEDAAVLQASGEAI